MIEYTTLHNKNKIHISHFEFHYSYEDIFS